MDVGSPLTALGDPTVVITNDESSISTGSQGDHDEPSCNVERVTPIRANMGTISADVLARAKPLPRSEKLNSKFAWRHARYMPPISFRS